MSRRSILTGALVLTGVSVITRIIGMGFRIYLSNTIGAEGMGVFQLIMSLYALAVNFAASGVSNAVSRMTAQELARGKAANAKLVLRRAVSLCLYLSCAAMVLLLFFARPVGVLILKDERTIVSLWILAPSLPFLSVSACLRGYMVAARKAAQAGFSQLLEQIVRIGVTLWMVSLVDMENIAASCAMVVLGMTVGEIACWLYVAWVVLRMKDQGRGRADATGVVREIVRISLPIASGSYIRSGLRFLENVLTMNGLRTFGGDSGTATYGLIKGMVVPLLTFPLSLLSAFVMTLMPEVSRMQAAGNTRMMERTISKVLHYTSLAGVFIVIVFFTFGNEIGQVVYKSDEAGEMLRLLAFLCPIMTVEVVSVGILQALDQQVKSLIYDVLDSLVRIALVWMFVPGYGVTAFLGMMVVSNLLTCSLNLHRLLKVTRISFDFREWALIPFLAALAASQSVKLLWHRLFSETLGLWMGLSMGILITAAVYVLVLAGLGSVGTADFRWMLDSMKKGGGKAPKLQDQPV